MDGGCDITSAESGAAGDDGSSTTFRDDTRSTSTSPSRFSSAGLLSTLFLDTAVPSDDATSSTLQHIGATSVLVGTSGTYGEGLGSPATLKLPGNGLSMSSPSSAQTSSTALQNNDATLTTTRNISATTISVEPSRTDSEGLGAPTISLPPGPDPSVLSPGSTLTLSTAVQNSAVTSSTIRNTGLPSIRVGTSGTDDEGSGSLATPKSPDTNPSTSSPSSSTTGASLPSVPLIPSTTRAALASSVVLLSVELETVAAIPPASPGNVGDPDTSGLGNATTTSRFEGSRNKRQYPRLRRRQNDSSATPDPSSSSGFVGNSTTMNPSNCTDANLFVQVSTTRSRRY